MSGTVNRRNFLKMMGLGGVSATALTGCDLPSTVTLEEGKETVTSYLVPEEFVIPGVGVWYASTCAQCSAGCGVKGRVREGRVLKLEGNPEAALNHGKTCMMGQAGVQGHYNPDRISQPMMREGGQLMAVSWDKAMAAIKDKLGSAAGGKVAWMTGTVSGHQAALVNNHLEALGSTRRYQYETINTAVWQAVNKDMLGDAMPRLRIDKARVILSFGADFLGTWISPVHFAGEYAKFRTSNGRGTLIVAEPKMSITGGNADLWLPLRPGTEAALALGIANVLINSHNKDASALTAEQKDLINQFDTDSVTKASGVDADRIKRIAKMLSERSPSLVLAGAGVEGQADGYNAVAATMLLNIVLGNVGTTIEPSVEMPFAQLQAAQGSTKDLVAFASDAKAKQLDVAFFYGANPAYGAPDALGVKEALAAIPFKVAISQFKDETSMQADVVLPAASYLEDWGTHIPAYQGGQNAIAMQQPLMEKIHAETKGFGDIMLGLLQLANKDEYGKFADYYAYLRNVYAAMPASYKTVAGNDEQSWNAALQHGLIKVDAPTKSFDVKPVSVSAPETVKDDSQYPLHLVASARLGLWDGRHANLPWLQEAPDQISKVVWDSWAELHPSTAAKMGIEQGDVIKVSSANGSVTVKAMLLKGVHPDVVAIPMGQGHQGYGRYADGRGVNPLKILSPLQEKKTGELAMAATRVSISKTGKYEQVVHMGASDTQMGRRLVVTIPADQLRRTEEV
jgi:anaerobic selenocysteine-containing dehydrogenase